ncbi:MAG: hypothetical protein PHO64_00720 [Thiomonas sp.]|nr:hypothetical protein [Thiomonas sp.]
MAGAVLQPASAQDRAGKPSGSEANCCDRHVLRLGRRWHGVEFVIVRDLGIAIDAQQSRRVLRAKGTPDRTK